jgi:hypothetical protein
MTPSRVSTPASMPEQDLERVLLLSLIRIHLDRASMDALRALAADVRAVTRSRSGVRAARAHLPCRNETSLRLPTVRDQACGCLSLDAPT